MIEARTWPVRVMYLLIAAALAISLMITAAPALKVSAQVVPDAEWERVPTPSTADWVLAPYSYIVDYAVGDDGEVAYAIVYSYYRECDDGDGYKGSAYLLKSDDHAATWDAGIMDALFDELEDDFGDDPSFFLVRVACDPEDSDFVAVALEVIGEVHVYTSIDGGAAFRDTGEVEDGGAMFPNGSFVTDLAVSTQDDDERAIAIVGSNMTDALIFRSTAVGEFSTGWEDGRYSGWDNKWIGDPAGTANDINSLVVTDVKFAPSWAADNTILVTTVNGTALTVSGPYGITLQYGTWGTTEGWNEESVVAMEATLILGNVNLPIYMCRFSITGSSCAGMQDFRGIAGLTMPLDFAGRYADQRVLWVWVNYYDPALGNSPTGTIFRVDNGVSKGIGRQPADEKLWLTNVSYLGYISEGKALAGVLGTGGYAYNANPCYPSNYPDLFTDCCKGVQVYSTDDVVDMDICCYDWEPSCKPPTGTKAMAAFYVSDDPASSKAYAVALWSYQPLSFSEGAWSVSFDDGFIWNQLSLINTWIDYLSDVAVSPDCNKMMLVSINNYESDCECDSVWLRAENLPEAEEYSGKWLRTWCRELTGDHAFADEWGLLRLAPEETNGDTVYLVDYGTEIVYWNEMETLGCWEEGTATVDDIVDLAVKDKETIYALDYDGTVAMSDDFALGWHEPVDSLVDEGFTIAVWSNDTVDILVGGCDGEVSYSDDGGETFELLYEDGIASEACVTVAFDSYFDVNNTVYAALAWALYDEDNGIYRWVIGESEVWTDLMAEPQEWQLCGLDGSGCNFEEVHFTGLVLDNADGNPMTSADTGGVLYASFYGYYDYPNDGGYWYTGVARYLTPAEELVCKECGDWDYLIEGLIDACYEDYEESFQAWPDALKICGCLTPDTSSKLFAIDRWPFGDYDMCDGEDGTVWRFEDCYAKKAPDLVSPADGVTIPSDPCDCIPLPFSICWDRLCDACSYDIQFALDEDFTELIPMGHWYYDGDGFVCDIVDYNTIQHYVPGSGDNPCFSVMMDPDYRFFLCEFTYYWRIRASDAATGQIIHSWWSEPQSFTVAPGPGTGVELIAPEAGATGVARTTVGFTWSGVASADEYDWVLDNDADLSSPVDSKTGLNATAATYTGTALAYDTTYYWQVIAYKEGGAISQSTIGTFRTVVETPPPPEEEQLPTPIWVWVVIAIGAVLVIVVIVLIFRTRRV